MFWRRTISNPTLAISDRDGRWRVYADGHAIFSARARGAAGAQECRAWVHDALRLAAA